MRNKKLILVILGGILLSCVVLCALVYLLPTPEPTPVAIEPTEALATETSTQIPADTPIPTATPVDTSTPEPPTPTLAPTDTPLPSTDTPEPANTIPPTVTPKPAGLPGLTQADVKLNLEDRGFTCSELDSDEQGGVTYYFRDCVKESETVQLAVSTLSRSIIGIDTIEASATFFDGQGDDQLAADFLGFMATMPYEGAEPEQARTWVGETISKVDTGKEEVVEFGGVKMRLVGPVTSRILYMGNID